MASSDGSAIMKICILGSSLEKALKGEFVGGAEKQCALIAKALATRGHEVFVLESNDSEEKNKYVGKVKIVHTWRAERGLPALRFFTYRMPSLLKRFIEINPDVIYCRGTSMYGACLALAVKWHKKKFVWAVASDWDLNSDLTYIRASNYRLYGKLHKGPIFNLSAKTLLKFSDMVFCQTLEQLEQVKDKKQNAVIIPNICEQTDMLEAHPDDKTNSTCLWVGKFTGTKGESELLELAKLLPKIKFRAVGHVSKEFKGLDIYKKLLAQRNIILLGRMQHHELMREYSKAHLLVHTAPAEGFSNVFLEAWACSCPVVSLNVNPNKLLTEQKVGIYVEGDIKRMAEEVKRLLADPKTRSVMGREGRKYVITTHSIEKVTDRIENAFMTVCYD